MPKKSDRYVVKNPGGGWDVKVGGAKQASAHKDTQAGPRSEPKRSLGI